MRQRTDGSLGVYSAANGVRTYLFHCTWRASCALEAEPCNETSLFDRFECHGVWPSSFTARSGGPRPFLPVRCLRGKWDRDELARMSRILTILRGEHITLWGLEGRPRTRTLLDGFQLTLTGLTKARALSRDCSWVGYLHYFHPVPHKQPSSSESGRFALRAASVRREVGAPDEEFDQEKPTGQSFSKRLTCTAGNAG